MYDFALKRILVNNRPKQMYKQSLVSDEVKLVLSCDFDVDDEPDRGLTGRIAVNNVRYLVEPCKVFGSHWGWSFALAQHRTAASATLKALVGPCWVKSNWTEPK